MTATPKPSKLRLALIGVAFVTTVTTIAVYTQQLIIPLFLGLLTWGKAWLKTLTPKLALLLLKNGIAIQLRRILLQASTHVFVKSHRPWRRWIISKKNSATEFIKRLIRYYLTLPLWLKSTLALLILLATAGSSFAVFALLVIPQPVLSWMRKQVQVMLNKLGATQFFSAIWRLIIPATLRSRWYMYVKWTLGRQQVNAAKKIHVNLASKKNQTKP